MTTAGFVGRRDDLAEGVRAVLTPPAILCVTGPAGVGKSRLVAEILADRQLRTRTVLRGVCLPGGDFPCGAVFDALRAARPRAEPSPVTGALAAYLPEIAAYLPAALPPLPDPAAERHRLVRAVRDLLEALTPAVLVVEDVRWADDDTRTLLRYLASHPVEELSVVVTGQAGLPRQHVLELSPLDGDGVTELALSLVPGLSGGVLEELAAYTGGRPDLVISAVIGLLRTGEATLDGVPPSAAVRLNTASLLGNLSTVARAVVEAAAVTCTPVSLEVLAPIAGTTTAAAANAVTEAVRTGLLAESGAGRYSVEPGVVRRCVREGLAGPAARRVHLRALHVLRADPATPPAQLAAHARAAGRFSDWLACAEDTGTAAALGEILDEPALPPELRCRAVTHYARIARRFPDPDSITRLDGLVQDRRLGTAARGEARLALGTLLVRRPGRVEEGRTELALAVADLGAHAARAMTILADPTLGRRPVAEHQAWVSRVITDDEPALLAAATATLVHTADHDVPDLVRRSPDNACDRLDLADAHLTVASAFSWSGHAGRARAHLHIARRLSGGTTGTGLALRLDWWAGRWAGLAERAEAGADTQPDAAEAALVRASLAVATGDWPTAERWFTRTGLDTPEDAISPVVLAASAALIRMSLDRDDTATAAVTADRASDLFHRKENWAWAADVVPAIVRAWLHTGAAAEARELAYELAAAAARLDAPALLTASHAAIGAVSTAEGDDERALIHFERARHHAARMGAPHLAAGHTEDAIHARLRLGDSTAIEALTDVIAHYDQLGATRDANRGRHLLRDHGSAIHTRRWHRAGPRVLSPRERDVADLLSRDRSNQEIADTLLLSRRTVEHHVASVLRKLGLRSRREVAHALG
ncbi:regulatory protein, luxR family [Lentzea albidocapillata subsp. violacea]|uniref:Regulatory protein, luxR family n=1 Tax=Lentzea albidocapillata subsp. violacea TaxID=128104 RepID=A0A1G8SBS1_9PSEU|nr:LuxR family transcriptional regulator [Lentzea albidocapillata]SDJ26668.1 regulatory protein, luxR family [Lentzea albidocapillata subsp. violacea]